MKLRIALLMIALLSTIFLSFGQQKDVETTDSQPVLSTPGPRYYLPVALADGITVDTTNTLKIDYRLLHPNKDLWIPTFGAARVTTGSLEMPFTMERRTTYRFMLGFYNQDVGFITIRQETTH